MANTYATVINGRGTSTPVGGRSGVQEAHVRGWDAGVKVVPNKAGTEFEVYMTGGSHAESLNVRLGTVTLGVDGPDWEAAGTTDASDASRQKG